MILPQIECCQQQKGKLLLGKLKEQMSNGRPSLKLEAVPTYSPTAITRTLRPTPDTRMEILIKCCMYPKDQKSIIYIHLFYFYKGTHSQRINRPSITTS